MFPGIACCRHGIRESALYALVLRLGRTKTKRHGVIGGSEEHEIDAVHRHDFIDPLHRLDAFDHDPDHGLAIAPLYPLGAGPGTPSGGPTVTAIAPGAAWWEFRCPDHGFGLLDRANVGHDDAAGADFQGLADKIRIVAVDPDNGNDASQDSRPNQMLEGSVLTPGVFIVDAQVIEPGKSNGIDNIGTPGEDGGSGRAKTVGQFLAQFVGLSLHVSPPPGTGRFLAG